MYKYEYVTVTCDFSGFGLFSGNVFRIDDYRKIIDEKANQGYRYVGFIPTKQRGTEHIEKLDLIFEKEIKK